MYITRAADGPSIAKALGHCINSLDNVLLSFSLGRRGAALPEGTSGQDRTSPRAHVFGCKVLASELSQVVIDIGRVNRLALTGRIDVLKKLIAWQLLAPFDNRGEATVVKTHGVILPALATKVKLQRCPRNLHVPVPQRRQAKRTISARIFKIANANESSLQEPHHGSQHFFAGQAGERHILLKTRPELWQDFAEGKHAVVFGSITYGTPAWMIPVLLPSSDVASSGLHVPVWAWTDPHVSPCRRDSKGLNTAQHGGVAYGPAVHTTVTKAAASVLAPDAWLGIRHVA